MNTEAMKYAIRETLKKAKEKLMKRIKAGFKKNGVLP